MENLNSNETAQTKERALNSQSFNDFVVLSMKVKRYYTDQPATLWLDKRHDFTFPKKRLNWLTNLWVLER